MIKSDILRQSYIRCKDFAIVDDTYNASEESVIAGLDDLLLRPAARRGAILGDMLELGKYTAEAHERIGAHAAALGFSPLYFFGVYAPYAKEGALRAGACAEDVFVCTDLTAPERLTAEILRRAKPGDLYYAKASYKTGLCRVTAALSEIGGRL